MEFLFYFISGILYAEMILIVVAIILGFMYLSIKFIFWMFDRLGIENPFLVIYEFIKDKI